jgi:hypothetical protein
MRTIESMPIRRAAVRDILAPLIALAALAALAALTVG